LLKSEAHLPVGMNEADGLKLWEPVSGKQLDKIKKADRKHELQPPSASGTVGVCRPDPLGAESSGVLLLRFESSPTAAEQTESHVYVPAMIIANVAAAPGVPRASPSPWRDEFAVVQLTRPPLPGNAAGGHATPRVLVRGFTWDPLPEGLRLELVRLQCRQGVPAERAAPPFAHDDVLGLTTGQCLLVAIVRPEH
jgi:hypothetical protein